MRILVAEDDPVSLKLLESWLTKQGHEVSAARDGNEGWDLLRQQEFSVVLSDWMMPKCDGLELCRRIRQELDGPYVYFIVQTAKGAKEDLVEALDKGADDFLTKPIDFNELRVRLRVAERILKSERLLAQNLKEITQANARMRKDLESASKVQRSLLPDKGLYIPGLQWASAYEPCDTVAGDAMNIFRLDEEHAGLYILDVSGHGVTASLFAVTLSRTLSPHPASRSLLKRSMPEPPYYQITAPDDVTRDLNARFPFDVRTCQYFTLVYAVYNVKERLFRYTQAGHPPPVLCAPGQKPKFLSGGDAPVGIFPETEFNERMAELPPGGRLYLYTDGILELPAPAGEFYGEQRLLNCIEAFAGHSLDDSLKGILEDLRTWVEPGRFPDDVTILAFEAE
jgi:sigma-B regulation protein RsbU (phosphoserine phosphatase)